MLHQSREEVVLVPLVTMATLAVISVSISNVVCEQ